MLAGLESEVAHWRQQVEANLAVQTARRTTEQACLDQLQALARETATLAPSCPKQRGVAGHGSATGR
jgi:exonuclease SbcC